MAKPRNNTRRSTTSNSERLNEQAIPTDRLLEVSKFEEFLKVRAEMLAERATTYLQELAK